MASGGYLDFAKFLGLTEKQANASLGGGGGNWLTNLLGNKMFQELLGAAGADISQGTGGKNTLAALTKNIASQNYSKILQQILGGGMPGTEAKISDKGLTLNLARETPVGEAGPNPGQTGIPQMGGGASQGTPGRGMEDYLNPFGQGLSNLSASDLAGLDPQMLTQALGLKLQGEQFKQQVLSNIQDRLLKSRNIDVMENYYQGLLREQAANTEVDKVKAATALIKEMNEDQRTELQKNYEYAKEQGYKGSLAEFKVLSDDPSSIREYNYAKTPEGGGFKGSYMDFITKKAAAGAVRISLGEKVEEKEAFDKLGARSFFRGDWTKEIDKIDTSDEGVFNLSQSYIKEGMSPTDATKRAVLGSRLNAVRSKIEAAGGEIVGRKIDKGTYVYTVKWPELRDSKGKVLLPASTEEIRYANR